MIIKSKSKQLSLIGMFAAIIFVLAFTPIGYIQLPFIKATIIHIPVIVGSVLLGAKYGCILGFLFGVTSLISNTMTPVISSFVFSPLIPVPTTSKGSILALIVCFVPRILTGVFPAFVYEGMKKICGVKYEAVSLAIAGVIGSLINTLLVMHLIFLFFKEAYAAVRNVSLDAVYNVILGVIAVNGVMEAIVAGLLTATVCIPVKIAGRRRG